MTTNTVNPKENYRFVERFATEQDFDNNVKFIAVGVSVDTHLVTITAYDAHSLELDSFTGYTGHGNGSGDIDTIPLGVEYHPQDSEWYSSANVMNRRLTCTIIDYAINKADSLILAGLLAEKYHTMLIDATKQQIEQLTATLNRIKTMEIT